ncbi:MULTISPECIES: hypothetical protein [Acinetobacter]|uniref:hypothetical protein n=1 Tax=Acinetobacter TaxID=469 RepID=UPI0005EE5D3F|nr:MULTISPECIES: hypothetical protein [Acinetobacter]MBI1448184.1 hypothetical protein [Acinetobacter sp. AC1-2]MBP2602856.1 hypothetical protein [Acinetobacter calcoaceticus]GLG82438.1 hypothetical protein ACSO1_09600 [Acinetobacter calcoaceticus]
MSLPPNFEIIFASNIEFEFLTVEVYFYNYRIFQLNRENGVKNIEIEFLLDLTAIPNDIDFKFSLEDFYKVIEIAKNDLINYDKK